MLPSRSGNPQQNDRLVRMHLTLKLETTKLAARNFLQQQAKFDDFIACYNHLRPHQAMNNQFPMAAWRAGMDRIEAAKTVDMPLRLDNARRCPHTHSRRKSSSRKLLNLNDKVGPITP